MKPCTKRILIGTAALLIAAGGAVAGHFLYPAQIRLNVFGHETTVNATEIVFDGSEIPDLTALTDALSHFKQLQRADLGSFAVNVTEAEQLRSTLSGTELQFQTCATVLGTDYPTTTTVLDFSDREITPDDSFCAQLAALPALQKVVLGTQPVSTEFRDRLTAAYPQVEFSLHTVCEIYGQTLPEAATEINLCEAALDDTLAAQLAQFPALRKVNLTGCSLSAAEQQALRREFPNVFFAWTVTLAGKTYDSSVEEIDLSGQKVTNLAEIQTAAELLQHLQTLVMCDCGVPNEEMAALRAALPEVKVVWRVHFGRWSMRTDATAFSVLIYDYRHKRLTSEDIAVLQYCNELQALDLGHQAITDLSVIGDYLPQLRVLILADNRITDISPLAKLEHLHYLELFVNQITDLSPLTSCKELVDVNISYNHRLADVSGLLDQPLLERLWLEHTRIPAESFTQLRETYPDAKIVSVGTGSVDQGWRTHPRYFAMKDMYFQDYISELFTEFG